MKKTFKNIVYHATLCIAVACFVSDFLLGMDDVALLPNSSEAQALSFLLTEKLELFSYDMICSLAVTKECDRILIKTAAQRKNLFLQEIAHSGVEDYRSRTFIWHKYCIACGYKIRRSHQPNFPTTYVVRYISLDFENIFGHYEWNAELQSGEELFESLRFNEQANPYFYVINTYKNTEQWGQVRQIEELSFNTRLKNKTNICGLRILRDCDYAMSYFLDFPVLLKALLNSSEIRYEWLGKLCFLKGITIPDNYKACIGKYEYKSFDDLPWLLQKAINTRYQEQQNKKLR